MQKPQLRRRQDKSGQHGFTRWRFPCTQVAATSGSLVISNHQHSVQLIPLIAILGQAAAEITGGSDFREMANCADQTATIPNFLQLNKTQRIACEYMIFTFSSHTGAGASTRAPVTGQAAGPSRNLSDDFANSARCLMEQDVENFPRLRATHV